MWSNSAGLYAGLANYVRRILHASILSSQSTWEIHAMWFVGIPLCVKEAADFLNASSSIFSNWITWNHSPLVGVISWIMSYKISLLLWFRVLYVYITLVSLFPFFCYVKGCAEVFKSGMRAYYLDNCIHGNWMIYHWDMFGSRLITLLRSAQSETASIIVEKLSLVVLSCMIS